MSLSRYRDNGLNRFCLAPACFDRITHQLEHAIFNRDLAFLEATGVILLGRWAWN